MAVSGRLSARAVSGPIPLYRFACGSKEARNIKASLKHHLMLHNGTGEVRQCAQHGSELLYPECTGLLKIKVGHINAMMETTHLGDVPR